MSVARQDYNNAVRGYNAYIRRFPQVLTAKMIGAGARDYFEAEQGVTFVSQDELLATSDIVTIHMWLDEATEGMANRELFSKMRDGAMFFNLARGPMVVAEDLKWALRSGKLRYAGLDVFPNEPNEDPELVSFPNIIVTPHTSGIPIEGYIRMNTWAIKWFLDEA